MSKRSSQASEAMNSRGPRAEEIAPRRPFSRAALALGVVAAAGMTAVAIRFFPDLRRYLRIKSM